MTGIQIVAETVVAHASGVVAVNLETEKVIMGIDNGKYHCINPVGARIWDLLDKPQTFREIMEALMFEYDVSAEKCRISVLKFLLDMIDKRLIDVV